ncbi:MAG: glycosyltransferase family 9 protein [Thermoleophilia bacterium]|nr:glycosyltransferase family 9 protein [Thermoleophilia bacterium]
MAAAGHVRWLADAGAFDWTGRVQSRQMDDATPQPEMGLGPDPELVRELLAIRPGGLGDVVRAVPALRHLRATYPTARITVAAEAPARELLGSCPYVDRVIDLRRPSEALLERFEVAISFAPPGADAKLSVDDVNARFRAAWSESGEGVRGAIRPHWPERTPDASRMLRLAWLLGGDLHEDPSFGLWPSLVDRNGAAQLVAEASRPIALVHVGAGTAARRWPAERWTRVIDLLERTGFEAVLVGAGRDRSSTAAVVAGVVHPPLDLVGRTSVGELVGLLERCALFIGADSGPAALAGALGVRSVIVGPATAVEHQARPGHVDLVAAGACVRCGEHACDHPPAAAADVSLERVLGRLELAAATAFERWQAARIA